MAQNEEFFLEIDQDLRKIGSTEDLPLCPYGKKCYRKNAAHFREYRHPTQATTKPFLEINSPTEPNEQKKKTKKCMCSIEFNECPISE